MKFSKLESDARCEGRDVLRTQNGKRGRCKGHTDSVQFLILAQFRESVQQA